MIYKIFNGGNQDNKKTNNNKKNNNNHFILKLEVLGLLSTELLDGATASNKDLMGSTACFENVMPFCFDS